MCTTDQKKAVDNDHHVKLAKMLEDEMGLVVEPKILRLFIRANWDRVACLAHRIHGVEAA